MRPASHPRRRHAPALLRVAAASLVALACRPSPHTVAPVSPTAPAATPQIVVPDAAAVMSPVETSGRCESSHAAALHMFPDQATLVAGVDLASVIRSAAYAPFLANDAPGELKHVLAAATTCGLGRESWRSITMAMTTAGGSSAASFRAEGAGSIENLECLRTEMKKSSGKEPFTIAATQGMPELNFPDEAHGWVLDPCTVLVVSKDWIAPTRARMEGRGIAVSDGRLAAAIARADSTKHAWLAAEIDGSGFGPQLAGARDLAVSIQSTSRATLAASMAFADPSTAAKAGVEVERQLSSMKSMFVSMGVPQTFADRIKIGPAGAFLMITADADDGELTAFAKLVKNVSP